MLYPNNPAVTVHLLVDKYKNNDLLQLTTNVLFPTNTIYEQPFDVL